MRKLLLIFLAAAALLMTACGNSENSGAGSKSTISFDTAKSDVSSASADDPSSTTIQSSLNSITSTDISSPSISSDTPNSSSENTVTSSSKPVESTVGTSSSVSSISPTTSDPSESSSTTTDSSQTSAPPEKEENDLRITITAGGRMFSATLYDNETARAFKERLPLTLDMSELNGNEKYYYLPDSLPKNSSSPSRINAGDIMLYGSDCLVIFYESFSTSYSYTPIGKIDDPDGLAAALGSGSVRVNFN